jgi:hypothetical protein
MARQPRFSKLFEVTHKNKKGELCSERAKGITVSKLYFLLI